MSLCLASLNSGSNGNCYYIGNETEAVFVDAGISCRETLLRMDRLCLQINNIKAIFITHEHTDHTRGVEVLSRRHNIPVYITAATYKRSRLMLNPSLLKHFTTGVPVQLGSLRITPFTKMHDACEPHSFTINYNGVTAGVFTDIGSICEQVAYHFSQCDAAFLEANYDEKMLENGRYTAALKSRIRGLKGHLSNKQALELFTTCRSNRMKLLFLSHLSAENNHPQLAYNVFKPHAGDTKIIVASRHTETDACTI
ncbi:MAG: MBL fold metallo-hydrolase [Bacteroidetes bacterium]|nr:MBL fold metallo-hydrolase [Bacteroidota bacterium]